MSSNVESRSSETFLILSFSFRRSSSIWSIRMFILWMFIVALSSRLTAALRDRARFLICVCKPSSRWSAFSSLTSSCWRFWPTSLSSSSRSDIFFSPTSGKICNYILVNLFVLKNVIYALAIIWQMPFDLPELQRSKDRSSSPSIVASFRAISSNRLSDSAIVNLSSFNWDSSLSPCSSFAL